MTEKVDIFDEYEKKIGTVTKLHAQKNHLLRRSGTAFIYNSHGQILIHKRSDRLLSNPGAWDYKSGGWVKSGESPIACVKREVKEELGIVAKPEFVTKIRYISRSGNDFAYFYRMLYDGKIKAQKTEVSDYEWVMPSEIKKLFANRKFANNAVRLYGQFESLGMFPDEWASFRKICEQSIKLDPWVKKRGLKGYVEEISLEAKELEKAVHNNDSQNTKEELGDVLHDWMHACILAGKKHGFTFDDVLKEINAKMGRRKPYLKEGKQITLSEAKAIWEKVKEEERA